MGSSQGHLRYVADMLRNEGPLRFYRGIMAPLMQEPLKRSVKFVSNRTYNDMVIGSGTPTIGAKLLCGFLAGSTEAFCISPFEAVKIRMQAKNRVSLYQSSWHCARTMWAQEGIWGFSRGLEASLLRSGVWNGVYFGSIYELKRRRTFGDSTFWPGFVGGCLGVVFNNPLDVIVARVRWVLVVESLVLFFRSLPIPETFCLPSRTGGRWMWGARFGSRRGPRRSTRAFCQKCCDWGRAEAS